MYACGWKPESSAMHATAASAMPRTLEKSRLELAHWVRWSQRCGSYVESRL